MKTGTRMWLVAFVGGALVGALLMGRASIAGGDAASAKEKDVRRLLEVTGAGSSGKQMMEMMINQLRKSSPTVPAEFWTEFAKEINTDELVSLIVPIYAKHLEHEDVKSAIVFYESPAGKNFIKAQPMIQEESMAVGQKWGMQLGMKVQQKLMQLQK